MINRFFISRLFFFFIIGIAVLILPVSYAQKKNGTRLSTCVDVGIAIDSIFFHHIDSVINKTIWQSQKKYYFLTIEPVKCSDQDSSDNHMTKPSSLDSIVHFIIVPKNTCINDNKHTLVIFNNRSFLVDNRLSNSIFKNTGNHINLVSRLDLDYSEWQFHMDGNGIIIFDFFVNKKYFISNKWEKMDVWSDTVPINVWEIFE